MSTERGFLLVSERLHFLEGFTREIVFDLDRHAQGLHGQTERLSGCKLNVLRIPTLVRLLST